MIVPKEFLKYELTKEFLRPTFEFLLRPISLALKNRPVVNHFTILMNNIPFEPPFNGESNRAIGQKICKAFYGRTY